MCLVSHQVSEGDTPIFTAYKHKPGRFNPARARRLWHLRCDCTILIFDIIVTIVNASKDPLPVGSLYAGKYIIWLLPDANNMSLV